MWSAVSEQIEREDGDVIVLAEALRCFGDLARRSKGESRQPIKAQEFASGGLSLHYSVG